MLKLIINDGEFSCELESFSEGLNRQSQDNQTFSTNLVLYEITANIKNPEITVDIFTPYVYVKSISSIQIKDIREGQDEVVLFDSQKFSEIFNVSRLINKYEPSESLITLYFRSVQDIAAK